MAGPSFGPFGPSGAPIYGAFEFSIARALERESVLRNAPSSAIWGDSPLTTPEATPEPEERRCIADNIEASSTWCATNPDTKVIPGQSQASTTAQGIHNTEEACGSTSQGRMSLGDDIPTSSPSEFSPYGLSTKWSHLSPSDQRRHMKRWLKRAKGGKAEGIVKGVTKRKKQKASPLQAAMDFHSLPVARSAWVGIREVEPDQRVYTLDELVGPGGLGMTFVDWNGTDNRPILDIEHTVGTVLLGRPSGPEWHGVAGAAANILANAHDKLKVDDAYSNRRRSFLAMATGVSFGGGQTHPMNIQQHGEDNDQILRGVASTPEFRRISGFASRGFLNWAPKVHRRYEENMTTLEQADASLARPFETSPWAAATFNFGPKTVCLPHLDSANLPWGWCAITALGQFDPDKGGHLVLWDYGLVIRFPPGSTILVASAIRGRAVQMGVQRPSLGASSNPARARKTELAKREVDRGRRWMDGYALFKKYTLFEKDAQNE
ncbi:hypothetical protein HGRIS_000477 [Hohenbuehelia grisea]|uniref:Uncharacterized protein n=1 Tax=Hohenbuehelia grisea TaxID=104357 RepID=A0ABR3JRB6_9AGAR